MAYTDYDQFADVYDRHWGGFGVRVVEPLDQLGLSELIAGDRLLDLCCGTGQLAAVLTERGLDVIGVDGSAAMVAHARRNAPDVEFVVADAREFGVDEPVKMAVSTFDSLNHVMTSDGLKDVFDRVVAALVPGGCFVFDLNMEAGYVARWHGVFVIDEPGEFIVGESSWDAEDQAGVAEFTWFAEDGGRWSRHKVTLTQRCYSEAEIRLLLAAAGFVDITVHDAATLVPGAHQGRSFFVATRPE